VSGLPTIVVLAAESHRKPGWLQQDNSRQRKSFYAF
jgi:hypothetical protein